MEDTIVAISTALGVGAISIIRVSGKESISLVNHIFKGHNLTTVDSHTIHYGHIIDKNEMIDEVFVSVFHAPKTFTMEDTVEINCHGSIATTNKVLELLLSNGCRLAEPGEFTKRAFLNGRIDLLEAEGVMDLIEAKTEKARKLALNQVSGSVSKLIHNLRQQILEVLANIEVNIDYPEYEDILELTIADLKPKMTYMEEEIQKILKESQNGKIVREGIQVAIIGRPNAGKSSLLNALLEEEKAIVTEIEGTTRDCVEGTINLDGILLNIIDTAGIRQTEDIVEKIGVEKSRDLIQNSDLILFVLDNSKPLNEEEKQILTMLQNKKYVIIVNKIDLENNLEIETFNRENLILMSVTNQQGLYELKDKIKEMFHFSEIKTSDLTYLSNARSIAILRNTLSSVEDVKKGIQENMPIDLIEIDLKEIWNQLGLITGESYEDELIDQLFSQFCLGK